MFLEPWAVVALPPSHLCLLPCLKKGRPVEMPVVGAFTREQT